MVPPTDGDDESVVHNTDPLAEPWLAPHADAIRATILPYVQINVLKEKRPGRIESKFGGEPYLPLGVEIPKGSDDRPLHLLAQLNFDEIPVLPGFPQSGMLQFFISEQDGFGADFNDPTNQADFRVLFWPTVDRDRAVSDFSFMAKPSWSPLNQKMVPMGLSFERMEAPLSHEDYRFDECFGHLGDEFRDAYSEAFGGMEHQIGGYPIFDQEDPRPGFDPEFTVLLLQLTYDDGMSWGDGGVSNFFMREVDFANRDFSRVFYTWDCL